MKSKTEETEDYNMSNTPEDISMRLNSTEQLIQQLFSKLDEMSYKIEAQSQQPIKTPSPPPGPTPAPAPAPASAPAPEPTSKPRHSLPHPPMFGGNKSQWRGWKLEMEGKIEEDAQAIGDLKAQLRYVYSRLEGSAKTSITTYFEIATKQNPPNPQGLLGRLDLLYGERNREQKAIQNLHSIRQKEDETFISFYPRFEKEIANANAEGWVGNVKISYLRNAINDKMRDKLIGLLGSNTLAYEEFVQKCVDVSNDIELYGQRTKRSGVTKNVQVPATTTTTSSNATTQLNREDMMEWEPTQPTQTQMNAVRSYNGNINGYPSKRPEDKALLGKRARWVEQEEIDARRRERRCLRCGRSQCRIATCPLAAAIRPKTISINTNAAVEDDLIGTDVEQ